MITKNEYQLVIIGAGPAGLTASIYASRYQVNNLIISETLGGMAFEAHKICNFPTEKAISGMELITKMKKHAENAGNKILMNKIVSVDKTINNKFKIITRDKKEFIAETVLLANGTAHRKVNLPNENKFIGHGISYCATCDAMFFKDKVVAVIGGSDSANTTVLYLSAIASKVYQIYRGEELRGEKVWIQQILNNKKIEILYENEVKELVGDEKLTGVILKQPYKNKKELELDGLFVEIGTVPQKVLVGKLSLAVDIKDYIKVNINQQTNQLGVWAAGDITDASNNFHQIVTACSEGAIAASDIFNFLQKKK